MIVRSLEKDMESLINEVTELKRKHFDSAVEWYQRHSKTPRILFRVTGYLLIFLSVTIPFLTTLTFSGSKILLSVIALLVAALTGINSCAKWDAQWREYKRAQAALEKLEALWDMQLIEARLMPNKDEAQNRHRGNAKAV